MAHLTSHCTTARPGKCGSYPILGSGAARWHGTGRRQDANQLLGEGDLHADGELFSRDSLWLTEYSVGISFLQSFQLCQTEYSAGICFLQSLQLCLTECLAGNCLKLCLTEYSAGNCFLQICNCARRNSTGNFLKTL